MQLSQWGSPMFHLQTSPATHMVWEVLSNKSWPEMRHTENVVCVRRSNLQGSHVSCKELWYFFMNRTSQTVSWFGGSQFAAGHDEQRVASAVCRSGQVCVAAVCERDFDSWSSLMKCNKIKGILTKNISHHSRCAVTDQQPPSCIYPKEQCVRFRGI